MKTYTLHAAKIPTAEPTDTLATLSARAIQFTKTISLTNATNPEPARAIVPTQVFQNCNRPVLKIKLAQMVIAQQLLLLAILTQTAEPTGLRETLSARTEMFSEILQLMRATNPELPKVFVQIPQQRS